VKWKERISRFVLSRYKDNERIRKGCNLRHAESVGLLYLERDHEFYRTIKDLAKHLRDELGVKRVSMLSFVDEDAKRTPGWLVKKLDSGYFCKADLNWYGKPRKEVGAFTEVDFDILFDLELDPILPLKHVLMMSNAKMKVGSEQQDWSITDYDIKIGRVDHPIPEGEEDVNPKLVWKEQIERTFKFISEVNIQ
jgi:hypothetical protein